MPNPGHAVRIMSEPLLREARQCAEQEARSVGRQIEYWAKYGKLALDNPDLPLDFIRRLLAGHYQVRQGRVSPLVMPPKRKK